MTVRLHVAQQIVPGTGLNLPPGAAKHVQVRRLQPGDDLRLFDGRGGEWEAIVVAMERQGVRVQVGDAVSATPELRVSVTLALGVPANERMDSLVEKATELGVAAIQPLECERSVLRLAGERALRRQAHWQSIAAAACEQCGRATLPTIAPIVPLAQWLAGAPADGARWLLSTAGDARALHSVGTPPRSVIALSGPEGGFSPVELHAARSAGFIPVSLGPRVLRADTAPLALMAWVGLLV